MLSPQRRRLAITDWIRTIGPTHAITLNPKVNALPLDTLRDHFSWFCRQVDELRLERTNVSRSGGEYRMVALGFPEHLESNGHVHVAARIERVVGKRAIDQAFFAELDRRWARRTHSNGQLHVVEDCKADGWATYITKELPTRFRASAGGGVDFFWSADFHSKRKVVEYGELERTLAKLE